MYLIVLLVRCHFLSPITSNMSISCVSAFVKYTDKNLQSLSTHSCYVTVRLILVFPVKISNVMLRRPLAVMFRTTRLKPSPNHADSDYFRFVGQFCTVSEFKRYKKLQTPTASDSPLLCIYIYID